MAYRALAGLSIGIAIRSAAIALAALLWPHEMYSQTGCLIGSVVDHEGQPVKGILVGVASR